MSANPQNVAAQFPVPVDSRLSGRPGSAAGEVRSAGRPVRVISPAIPKVGLSDICLSYRTHSGQRLLALDHINLEVRTGEFVCVVGPSGCGKSTLLLLIAGLHPPAAGEVLIDGKPVEGPGTDRIMIF